MKWYRYSEPEANKQTAGRARDVKIIQVGTSVVFKISLRLHPSSASNMGVIWVAVLIMASSVFAAPAVKYDQRQEGDVNVRADLENFVILIIPTSNSNSLGLLDLLTKAMPNKGALKNKRGDNKKPSPSAEEETQHFIESKTAPYHVDISRTRSNLAKLHPALKVAEGTKGEVLIAHSPIVALSKTEEKLEDRRSARSARNIIINRQDDVQALILTSDIAVDLKKADNNIDKSESKGNKEDLLLLGSELVQCGPDQKRDVQGICQLVKS